MVDGSTLVSLMGLQFDSPEIANALAQLRFAGKLARDKGDPEAYATCADAGVELLFHDQAYVEGKKKRSYGEGPFILTSVFFFDGSDGEHARYAGELPGGIRFAMSLEDVTALLGAPEWRNEAVNRYRWPLGKLKLILRSSDDRRSFDECSVQTPLNR